MEGRGGGAIVGLAALPALPDLDAFRERLGSARDRERATGMILVGVDVEDPGNVGALVRTALASGADAYVRCGSGDPFHPRAVRTSMGAVFRLPLVDGGAPAGLPKRLRAAGWRALGAVARGGTSPVEGFVAVAPDDVAVLLGSEAFGLDEDTVHKLDARVTIPMPDGVVDSFSVNAAAAILLWERRRA